MIFRQQGPPSRGITSAAASCRRRTATCSSPSAIISPTATRRRSSTSHIGKIVRITPDGSVPPDNPFVGKPGALPEIWAYGHRNAQGLAFNPADGKLWEQEHGPKGGDEINIIEQGQELRLAGDQLRRQLRRHAGRHRQGADADGMEQPIWHWMPSIAPSGMAFYTGDLFPAWKGSLFDGALQVRTAGAAHARRRHGRRRKSACCKACASASATCGRARTARSICSPTTPPAASCACAGEAEKWEPVFG